LLRLLGVGFGVAVTVGGTVGVGILRTPGMVAARLQHPWLVTGAWLVGGLYALLGTLCVVELGAALPSAGGWYVYARRAFGDAGGFSVGWSDWLVQSASLAYVAVSVGDFAAALWPALAAAAKVIAVLTLVLFAFIQGLGLRSGSLTQELTSLVKGLALVAFVGLCFLHREAAPSLSASGPSFGLVAVVLALQSVIVTYDGWYTAIYFTEEDRDPGRNLPRSAIGGVSCTIAIYVLVNLGLLHVLGVTRLVASSLAAADAAQVLFGGAGGAIVTALSLVSLAGVINAVLLLATRILFAVARDGRFAPLLVSVNPSGTPVPAMLLTTAVASLLVLSGTFEQIIAVVSVLAVVVYGSGFLALLVLRRREPDLPRPFRVPGYPALPLGALLGSLAFLVAGVLGDPRSSLLGGLLLAASHPVYRLLSRRKLGPQPATPADFR
jgi:APA family basic amino acid/polyamine antiporter